VKIDDPGFWTGFIRRFSIQPARQKRSGPESTLFYQRRDIFISMAEDIFAGGASEPLKIRDSRQFFI